ncbi:unnamed protein product [Pleuronectes platessa]|uniref:Uncharacterized protein n=1 Tax=Pleuronectes platessa TaxID=8262 RepID=A0A9N7UIV7_PLEPL|nr:unnamed protein product [Pleuronectes platessa]
MSSMDHHGARAASRPDDLSETVASLINVSIADVREYDLSTCDQRIEELTMHLNNTTEIRKEQDQAGQERKTLHAQVQDQQKVVDSQTGLASPDPIPLRTGPRADVIPGGVSGTETLGEQL